MILLCYEHERRHKVDRFFRFVHQENNLVDIESVLDVFFNIAYCQVGGVENVLAKIRIPLPRDV